MNIKMKETKYFVALHLHLAIARHRETSQLVCNSHESWLVLDFPVDLSVRAVGRLRDTEYILSKNF